MGKPGIKTLWGLAKSPELSLSDEELHLLVAAHTGKESIRKLSQRELEMMAGVLGSMRAAASRNGRSGKQLRGNAGTANQRKKIYRLTETLGWDKPSRLGGMCRRMFGVDRVEWLDYSQCSKLIEALKSMADRRQKGDGTADGKSDH